MQVKYRFMAASLGLVAFLAANVVTAGSVNKNIKIDSGATSDGASTVNGSISIGANAVVSGSVETVNGTIRVGNNAMIGDAETVNGSLKIAKGVGAKNLNSVNGSVRVGESSIVDGEVSVVNGDISLGSGSRVSNDVSNVNGEIRVTDAEIAGNLRTVTGDVLLEDESVLQGNLTVEKPRGWRNRGNWMKRKPRIIIGPDSRVAGNIVLEREVELFISDSADIGGVTGEMTLDDATRFSGDRPKDF